MKPDSFIAHYRQSDGTVQFVRDHLIGTADLARSFAKGIGLPSIGELMGLLHDVGKYSEAFQAYLSSAAGEINPEAEEYIDTPGMKGKIDHSSSGAQYIWEATNDTDTFQCLAGQMIALCVASHHSGLIDCLSPVGNDSFRERMAKSRDLTHLHEVIAKADGDILTRITTIVTDRSIEKELRHRVKLLYEDEHYREIREFMLGLLARFLFSVLIDADRLNTADFENETAARERYNGAYPEWAGLIGKLEAHLNGFPRGSRVDDIRAEVSSHCLTFAGREKGLFNLTVPTGGGKTLASFRFALHHAEHHQMDRIIHVVPYTSIIDQNAATIRKILEGGDSQDRQIVLEHHSNLTPEKDTWRNTILSENWDAPVVFTTTVQLLETLFSAGTRGVRRMHQLANAVIIFDEIQTLPVRTVHLFNNAVNFLVGQCGASVVFCTATQPLLGEVDAAKGAARFSKDPGMIPDVEALFRNLRRVEIIDGRKAGGWTAEEVSEAAREEMERAGSVLVIVNMKAQAREVYRRCKEKAETVFHLSTSMCPAHRMDVLGKIKECLDPEDPKPVICVSTQLIEAGVDVDFGAAIRYLAGLDSIAQAAGRCNRNGRRLSGRVLVVNPANENLDHLPDIRIAREKAERVLDEFRGDPSRFDHDLLSPAALRRYYAYYFFGRKHEMTYPVSPPDVERDDNLFSLLSLNGQSVRAYANKAGKAPPLLLRQSFRTAAKAFTVIDAPTEGVIAPYGEAGMRIIGELAAASPFAKTCELMKRAQRYSVNLFPHEIRALKESRGVHETQEGSGILYLDPRHYSSEFGASVEQSGLMEPLIFTNGGV
jgi:CRISPR-associated endonuclease/helicase Cas3